jgi:hypothetical protein
VGATALPADPKAVPNVIPYTLALEEVTSPVNRLPVLQAHCMAPAAVGGWYAVGGRITGLHQFNNNGFPVTGQNTSLWYIDPKTLANDPLLDLTSLPPEIGKPLMATNPQCYFDGASWYIAGGYGSDPVTGKLTTFDTLLRLPLEAVAALARDNSRDTAAKAAAIAAKIEVLHDPLFRTTGGVLHKVQNYFVLAFGQQFEGNYNPFGTGFVQQYNEVISYFTLKPGKLALLSSGSLLSGTPDHAYHRRDFPVAMSVDPNTGSPQLAVFAGVFPPGILAGYTNAIYISEKFGQLTAAVDNNLNKRFSAYQCPTIPLFDKAAKTAYYTFVGGIGHYWYFQTPSQHKVFEDATAQGRSDGLPFTEDIDTVIRKSDGSYAEYIAPQPFPGGKLRGASIDFLPAAGGHMLPDGVVDLNAFGDGESAVIGHFFGGIDADNPFPVQPNTGTQANNSLYRVTLTKTPWAGIPASEGHEAKGASDHGKDVGSR